MNARQLGIIFAEISIDDAARAAVNASKPWDGEVIVTVDDQLQCAARVPHVPETERHLKRRPHELVGSYVVNLNTKADRKRIAKQIAEDIWVRNSERRVAA